MHDLHVLESSAALDVRSSVEVEVDDHDVHGPTGPRLHCDHAAPGAAKVHRPAVDRPRLVRPTDGKMRARRAATLCVKQKKYAGVSETMSSGCSMERFEARIFFKVSSCDHQNTLLLRCYLYVDSLDYGSRPTRPRSFVPPCPVPSLLLVRRYVPGTDLMTRMIARRAYSASTVVFGRTRCLCRPAPNPPGLHLAPRPPPRHGAMALSTLRSTAEPAPLGFTPSSASASASAHPGDLFNDLSSRQAASDRWGDRPSEVKFGIKAFYVGRSVNISEAHHQFCLHKPHRFRRDFLMVSFPAEAAAGAGAGAAAEGGGAAAKGGSPTTTDSASTSVGASPVDLQGATSAFTAAIRGKVREPVPPKPSTPQFGNKHMVIFNYGSVVFFNFGESEAQQLLYDLRPFCVEPIRREVQMTEDYTIIERPHLRESCVLQNDLTVLRELDLHSATVISTVMAQTVALDSYSVLVDKMLDEFTDFNHSVEKTGLFTAIPKNDLYKLVAKNNAVLIDVLSKLSLLERSDIAWRMPQYVHVWEGLREEFEVEPRFSNLKYKLNLIQDNTKFFLEVMHNQKSNMLEWIIIVLISAEIVVCR